MANPIIECVDIRKIYINGDVKTNVLKGISLSINKGEFIAIMGPSGSGKSTLMHILGCLDTPTSGTYKFAGDDVSKLSDDDLADIRSDKVGFVFQSFNLLSRSTVLRNVMLPLIFSDVPKEKREKMAKEALKDSGLPEDRWNHLSNQLSGGQMQRVAIARALVNNPSIILADEPTGNLDIKTGEMVMETFEDLNDNEGHTIILITHEEYIAEYADRIVRLRDGEIISDEKNGHRRRIKPVK